MPVRGKILNCLKRITTTFFKSEIITDLIRVMGCGSVDLGGKAKDLATFGWPRFRLSRWSSAPDADVDGYQIRTLILTMLYRLGALTHRREATVYIAECPLYEINTKKQDLFCLHRAGKGGHSGPH